MFPLNLPNALTLARILLVPVLVAALTVETPGGSTIAAIVFALAALTDGLDGSVARSRQAVTTFGKVMDPIADKLTIAAALIASGADYFLNFRRRLEGVTRARGSQAEPS